MLVKHQILPYLAYLTATIFYLQYALEHDETVRVDERLQRTLFGSITLLPLTYQIYHEYVQIREAVSLTIHFRSVWNVNDAIWLTLCPVIVVMSIPSQTWIGIDNLASMAAFATFSMFVKVLDWMRLFD